MKKFSKEIKKIVAGALAVSLMVGLSACGSTTETAEGETAQTEEAADAGETTASAEKIPLKISHHPYIHALPSVYAEENGLYDTFDYTITQYSGGPTQNEAIPSKGWEVGSTGTGGAILGASGYDLKVIGYTCGDTNTTDLWVRADSDLAKLTPDANGVYGTAEDWKGKKILCPTGTSCHMVLIGTMQHLGLDTSDVEIIDMAVAQSFPAFKAGEADIVALWSPFGFAAEDEGWVKVSSAKGLGIELPCLIVATDEAVKERPEVVQQWLQAYVDSAQGLNADHDSAVQMLYDFEKQEGIKMDEKTAELEVTNRPFPTKDELKELFKEGANGQTKAEEILLVFADFMIDQGKIQPEDKQRMIDNGFVDPSFVQNLK